MSKDIVEILLNEWEAAKMDTPHGLPAFKDGADEIVRLREENKRLRGLLEKCQPYIVGWNHAGESMVGNIKKALGDER